MTPDLLGSPTWTRTRDLRINSLATGTMLPRCSVTIQPPVPEAETPGVLKDLGGAGILEVMEDDRAVYIVKFAEVVFVLHCFQKKNKRGTATPKDGMDIIHVRLKIAERYVKELRK
jgi:hypothetical protein